MTGESDAVTAIVDALRPANGGEVVARHDGRVMFVRGAIPGERVRVRVTDDRRSGYTRAEVVEVLDPSPYRRPPLCPAASHGAGCCDLSFIDASHLCELKSEVLVDVLTRIGGMSVADIDAAKPYAGGLVRSLGDHATGWRVRTRLGVDRSGRAGVRAFRGSSVVGGYACVQPEPSMVAGLDAEVFTPGSDLAIVADMTGARHIVEIAPPASAKPVRRRGRGPDTRRAAQADRRRRAKPRATRVVEGSERASHRVGNRVWQIPVTGFWQAHRSAPAVYSAAVLKMLAPLDLPSVPVAWDLYGGAGVFAAALLDGPLPPAEVHIVESDSAALAAATEVFNGDDRIRTVHGEVARSIGDLPAPDVVVADPPRTGAGEHVVSAITAAGPAAVIHVGCDAGRFARDLALFTERGYRVREVRGFDAFPLTHHVEAIACLVPAGRSG